MSSVVPSGRCIVTPRTPPSSERNAFFAMPRMSVAPRLCASSSIIASKSLLRTCQVVPGWSSQFSSRRATGINQLLVPKTRTPCLTGYARSIICFSRPSRRKQVARFASHRLSDMKAGEFLLFENDRLDAFFGEKHRCGCSTRPSADNQDISFHIRLRKICVRRDHRIGICLRSRSRTHSGGLETAPTQQSKFCLLQIIHSSSGRLILESTAGFVKRIRLARDIIVAKPVPAGSDGARYRVRTCDPYRVKVVLYH